MMDGRPVVIGCPKLDDGHAYVAKLAQIITAGDVQSITVSYMEIPCCTGLLRIAEAAVAVSGRQILVHDVTITLQGQIVAPGSTRG
jgi:hypothetical protein